MIAAVDIGGVRLRVDAWDGPAAHIATWGPFLGPGPTDLTIPLALLPPHAPPPRGDFTVRRPDLHFAFDGTRAVARVDDSLGACEAAVQLALEAALLPHGGLVVHASGGVRDGLGWLFPGPSGTGKSTAVRQGGFDAVLSDELCVLRTTAEGPMIWGTPYWSADRPLPMNNGHAPLSVLARLVKDSAVGLEPMPAADAAAWLLRSTTLYRHDPAARARAFATACDVAAATRCVRLRFPRAGLAGLPRVHA